jgi:replicative DNA helicase
MALPKHGKSTVLVNFGTHALLTGRNVLHVSLENYKEQVAERYDTRIFDRPIASIRKLPKTFVRKMEELRVSLKSKLEIAVFPTKSLTLAQLESAIASATKPDVVIVDYPALMRPPQRRDEKRHELTDIYEGIRRVAGEAGVPIWTAHQANRPGMEARTLGMQHIAECFEIAAIVDLAVSSNYDEAREGELKLFVMGSRLGRSGFEIACSVDWDVARVRAVLDEEEST